MLQCIYQTFVLAKKILHGRNFLSSFKPYENAKKEEKRRPLLYTSLSGALRVKK